MVLLFVVSALYVLALMAQGYSTYRYTDVLENMNGRYLLPILLFVAAIIGKALSIELRNSSSRKVIFVVAIVVLFLQGGGIFTFIARSDNTWDVNNTAVVKVNNAARHITNPVLVNGKENYSTKLWVFN
jgi:predicted permease